MWIIFVMILQSMHMISCLSWNLKSKSLCLLWIKNQWLWTMADDDIKHCVIYMLGDGDKQLSHVLQCFSIFILYFYFLLCKLGLSIMDSQRCTWMFCLLHCVNCPWVTLSTSCLAGMVYLRAGLQLHVQWDCPACVVNVVKWCLHDICY